MVIDLSVESLYIHEIFSQELRIRVLSSVTRPQINHLDTTTVPHLLRYTSQEVTNKAEIVITLSTERMVVLLGQILVNCRFYIVQPGMY